MTPNLSTKDWIMISIIVVLTLLSVPFLLLAALEYFNNQASPQTPEIVKQQKPQQLIEHCSNHINQVTETEADAIRIDKRSTGFRAERFNVHGYVLQQGYEYDFQCWFHADSSFDTHIINRVSLEEIRKASGAHNF